LCLIVKRIDSKVGMAERKSLQFKSLKISGIY